MKEHPIIFSTDMVKAILDGIKTQTRRVIKLQPWGMDKVYFKDFRKDYGGRICPYGQVGDRLWARETFSYIQGGGEVHDFGVWYKAGGEYKWWRDNAGRMNYPINEKNRPSIHMPRWASRITLEITEVRVEHLNQMTEADVTKEGVDNLVTFMVLWDRLNKKRGYEWKSNCWVWVITFKLCQ